MAKTDEIKVKVHSFGPGRPLALVWFDPLSGRKRAKSSGTSDPKEAEREAGELEKQLQAGSTVAPARITWQEFRQRYEAEKLPSLAPGTREAAATAFNYLERVLNPDFLRKLTASALSDFQSRLRKQGMKDTTLARNLRQLKAALNWGVGVGLLVSMPKIEMPKRAKGQTMMRGRPITSEEFDRMLLAVPKVRPADAPAWENYLTGLWLSGLRLEESLALSWDLEAPFIVYLTGRRPAFRIYAEAQKNHQDCMLPMTPDFAEWLLQTPEGERAGPVFKMLGRTGRPLKPRPVGIVIGKFGRRAGVVVNKADGKYASAHDLRRAFGTRWAPRVKPATLQLLMRHADISTTLKYYVSQDADDVADELWARWSSGNKIGNNRPQGSKPAPSRSTEPKVTEPFTSHDEIEAESWKPDSRSCTKRGHAWSSTSPPEC